MKNEVKDFLAGKKSALGEQLWNHWFRFPKSDVKQEELILTSPRQVAKEIRKIKGSGFRLMNLNSVQLRQVASVAIVVGLGSMMLFSTAFQSLIFGESMVTYTKVGEYKTIMLSDGTLVELHAGSKLQYPRAFNGATREVYLEGEAFFEVTKDKKHPFIIHTSKADTRVVGTSFNVLAYPNQSKHEVAVITGKVAVSGLQTKKQVLLVPGQKVVIDNHENQLKTYSNIPIAKISSWRNGILNFDDSRLRDVIEIIENHYDIKITVEGEGLDDLKINACFEKLQAHQVMQLLSTTINSSCTQTGNTYRLKLK